MKKLHELTIGLIVALLALTACESETLDSNKQQVDDSDTSGNVYIIGKDFSWEENDSRTSLKVEDGLAKFGWTPGDRVGILPDEGAQVFFAIPEPKEGEQLTNKAKFDGGAWALKAESDYAAYYPFVKDFDLDRTAVPVLYTGQKQVGNNNTAHLGDYDYMGSRPVQTNVNGGVTFDFDHVGALVLVKFTVPKAGTVLKNITLRAEDAGFTIDGTYDLTSQEGFPVTATTTSDAMTMDVEYTTIADNEEVTVYLMTAPVDLSDKTLDVSVAYGEGGVVLEYTCPGKNLQAAGGYLLTAQLTTPKMIDYLTFSADDTQTMTIKLNGSYVLDESLQYSVNEGAWEQLKAATAITFGGDNGTLRLRGKSAGGMATEMTKYAKITFGYSNVPVACSGDIRTLVDYEDYQTADTDEARFCYLFDGCKGLTSAPALPATTLADKSYYGMFRNCSGLAASPVLPATTLTTSCYSNMFYGCTGLTGAPSLPATTLANMCYYNMFYGCTGLASAPSLPATTLAESCYSNMFYGCTGLTAAPSLPATTLAKSCYAYMFRGCTGLTAAPALPATALAELCYYYMFYGCSGLTAAPALPATTLAERCYEYMFYGCSGLTSAPALPATTLAEKCYYNMFYNCTGLNAAPALPATTLAEYCYYYMFRGCTGLTSAPELPAATLVKYCYGNMFYGCTNLNSVTMLATDISASGCLTGWLKNVSATGTFIKDASMTSLPTGANGIPTGWTVVDYVAPEQAD